MDRKVFFILNKLILFSIGGISYLIIELLWRGQSHWSMFILGGLCFLIIGLLNEHYTFEIPLPVQMLIGAFTITVLEFCAGCILNLWLGLNVWDYSDLPYNILGQICLPYSLLWFVLSLGCILADDYIRYYLLGEEKPHYKLV